MKSASPDRILSLIMAGGASETLGALTEARAEPALHIGGKFRLIDFPLSNLTNSGLYNIGVLTQYMPRSLNDHIGVGKPWDLDRATGGVRLLQPYMGGMWGGAVGRAATPMRCGATSTSSAIRARRTC